MTVQRTDPPFHADEPEMLSSFLDYQRLTLEMKCEGLTEDQLRSTAIPPSTLTLLGLVRHMAEVERGWFRRTLKGEDAPPIYFTDKEPDGDFAVEGADIEEAFARWREECDRSRAIVAEAGTFDVYGTQKRGNTVSLRWIMVHMVEEYARHNGHADLLRERLDGSVGE